MSTLFQLHTTAVAMAVLLFSAAALADPSGTFEMMPGTYVAFDNGNGVGFAPIGDIGFDGTNLTFLGKAKGEVLPFTGAAVFYNEIDFATLESLAPLASADAIPTGMMPVGSILGIRTNRGNA